MVVLVYVWQNFGFTFLLFVGGLASIPQDVYEASSIDGATGWRQFRNITLPLLSPTLLVASVMAIISALQIFDQPYVLTRGGPGDSTRTAVMVIFESAFQQLRVRPGLGDRHRPDADHHGRHRAAVPPQPSLRLLPVRSGHD